MKEILNIQSSLENNVFKWIEIAMWDTFSDQLKGLFIRISLLEHLSPGLLEILIGEDSGLKDEFEQQSASVTFRKCINAYMMIQPLFLDYVKTKQVMLSEDEKRETYLAAATWSEQNNYLIDALIYYEKIGDQKSEDTVMEKIDRRIASNGKVLSGLWDNQMACIA